VENAGGLLPTTTQSVEDALYDDIPIEPVAMARETLHNTDATLTDEMESCGDTSAHKAVTILWKYVAFYIVRSFHHFIRILPNSYYYVLLIERSRLMSKSSKSGLN
jgi:hypothetical protein